MDRTLKLSKQQLDTVTTTLEMEIEIPKNIHKSIPKAKHWAGCTLNNYTAVDEAKFELLIQPLADYYVYGKEVGASGTPHLQFMVSFKSQKALTALKKIFEKAHWEVKAGQSTMLRASNYCKKGEQTKAEWDLDHEDGINYGKNAVFIEWGILPEDQTVKSRKIIADKYADTVAKAKQGNFEEIIPEHQVRYYKTIKCIQADFKVMPKNLDWKEGHQPNLWIYGNTGTGKSFYARKKLQDNFYAKIASNKWWDKYTGQDNVLIEDMDKKHDYQAYYLKIWADKYAFPVEIKNGADLIRPKVIVVTSNYSIREIFPNPQDYEPLERRFKVVHKKEPWNKNPFNMLDIETTVGGSQTKVKLPDYRIPTEKIVGTEAWENAAKKVFKNSKKRKYDQPLKAKKPLKQNKAGKIVPNNDEQMVIESFADSYKKNKLAETQEIAKEKEVIEIMDSDAENEILENDDDENDMICIDCDKHWALCTCDIESDNEGYISTDSECNATEEDSSNDY